MEKEKTVHKATSKGVALLEFDPDGEFNDLMEKMDPASPLFSPMGRISGGKEALAEALRKQS